MDVSLSCFWLDESLYVFLIYCFSVAGVSVRHDSFSIYMYILCAALAGSSMLKALGYVLFFLF